MREAEFYFKKPGGVVECRLCRHTCVLNDGQTGVCGARKNFEGRLFSLVHNMPASLNVDPVEKKPLFHFQPGTLTFSLGTMGCNFKCHNCQNWEISQGKMPDHRKNELYVIPPEKIIEDALGDGCSSISFTYNEPTIFTEYALSIMKLAHQYDLKNIWVSNGFMSEECLTAVLPYLDAINVDLKSFADDFYRDNCGARLRPVLDNLIAIKKEQVHLEVTTLIIPGLTDDMDMLGDLADFIVSELDDDTPWHVTRFSPGISWKLKGLPTTSDDLIYQAYEIGKDAGLKYVYVGNIPGDQKENTYCPKCGEMAISRLSYQIERLDANGSCPACDRSLDIVE